ncbi:MAG: hypothetical protein OEZ22_13490 [Spirochaetia bacterium]|nr:hypothetical protein [Spirochaetia bacterium]
MKKIFKIKLLVPVLILSLNYCASMVKKPAVNKVKKIAIISVSANRAVYNTQGGGFTGLATLVADKESDESPAAFGGATLLKHAEDKFAQKLSEVESWQVINGDKVTANPKFVEYAKWVEDYRKSKALWNLYKLGTHKIKDTAHSIIPVMEDPEVKKRLGQLLKDLNVDTIMELNLDIAYYASFAIGGMGAARAIVNARVFALNSDLEIAVDNGQVRAQGSGYTSSNSTGMVASSIGYNGEVEDMYKEAIEKAAEGYKKIILEELNEK